MNRLSALRLIIGLALLPLLPLAGGAAEASPKADLEALVTKIKARLAQGENTAEALAPELKEFDALRARYRGQKTDDVAQIVMMQGALYAQVLEDDDKALALFQQLKTEFPETKAAQQADAMIAAVKSEQETNRIQRSLVVGSAFPEFAEPDLAGKELALTSYRGKVVLVDFWATWCGPCVAELPNVVAAYKKYHDAGFEVVGISLDRAGDREKLVQFTKDHGMPWRQIFDGKYWESKLAVKYGIHSIPATYLLDAEGKIAAKNLRGPALEQALAKMLAKK
jgi:peroxiredoxin